MVGEILIGLGEPGVALALASSDPTIATGLGLELPDVTVTAVTVLKLPRILLPSLYYLAYS